MSPSSEQRGGLGPSVGTAVHASLSLTSRLRPLPEKITQHPQAWGLVMDSMGQSLAFPAPGSLRLIGNNSTDGCDRLLMCDKNKTVSGAVYPRHTPDAQRVLLAPSGCFCRCSYLAQVGVPLLWGVFSPPETSRCISHTQNSGHTCKVTDGNARALSPLCPE